MGKKHYLGGGTLLGIGSIAKAKGRKGGVGPSGAAMREEQRKTDRKRKKALEAKIRENQKAIRKIGAEWAAEKGRKHFDELQGERRAKSSSLAAALRDALKAAR